MHAPRVCLMLSAVPRMVERLVCSHRLRDCLCMCACVCARACDHSRLVLCHATALCFRKCMELLGINPIERL